MRALGGGVTACCAWSGRPLFTVDHVLKPGTTSIETPPPAVRFLRLIPRGSLFLTLS